MNGTKKPPVTITGPTTCVVGARAGHDADELRANATSDGGILCVICGTSYPRPIVELFTALRGSSVAVTKIHNGSRIRETDPVVAPADNPHVLHISPYAAACLSGVDPNTFQRTRLELSLGNGISGELAYTPDDIEYALQPADNFGKAFEVGACPALPPEVAAFAQLLSANGYRLTGGGDEDWVRFMRGKAIDGSRTGAGGKVEVVPNGGAVFGITVELRW